MRRLYAATLFLSAALLFVVEPLFAKQALPRFGGTPAVWNACTVFFQAALLAGYGWSHLGSRLGPRRHLPFQLALLAAPLLFLPIVVPPEFAPRAGDGALLDLSWLLVRRVAVPFCAIATLSPLLQRWFAAAGEENPYPLFSASNAGSLAGLALFPLVLEPRVGLSDMSRVWSGGYALLLVLVIACAVPVLRAPASVESTAETASIAWTRRLRWLALGAVPSAHLIGVTTYISTDLASAPLLWALPLGLYLATFIIAFARTPPIPHRFVARALPLAVLLPSILLAARSGAGEPVWIDLPLHLIGFFGAALACHGALASDRPDAAGLTGFYLIISAGGVVGGLLAALVAPLVFSSVLEYPLAIACAVLLVPPRESAPGRRAFDLVVPLAIGGLAFALSKTARFTPGLHTWLHAFFTTSLCAILAFASGGRRPIRYGLALVALFLASTLDDRIIGSTLDQERSFFGVHRVTLFRLQPDEDAPRFHLLVHGTTSHGMQRVDASRAPTAPEEALTYYHRTGPIGQAFAELQPRSVAAIGLGAGTLAAYARPGQRFMWFEIDPAVAAIAQDERWFTYVSAARARGADMQIVLGDARLTIAREKPGSFGLVVVDAFSSDSVPLHLLTREALATFTERLDPEGAVAFHISNRTFSLEPALGALARDASMAALVRQDLTLTEDDIRRGKSGSIWLLIARDRAHLRGLARDPRWREPPRAGYVFTDDRNDVLSLLLPR